MSQYKEKNFHYNLIEKKKIHTRTNARNNCYYKKKYQLLNIIYINKV